MKVESSKGHIFWIVFSSSLLALIVACNVPLASPTTEPNQRVVIHTPFLEATSIPTISARTRVVATTTYTVVPITSTPSAPFVLFIKDANCRLGPGTNYKIVTYFLEGQTALIEGKNGNVNYSWWYVAIPNSNEKCWVSLVTTTANGNLDEVGVIGPPPAPATHIAPPAVEFTPPP